MDNTFKKVLKNTILYLAILGKQRYKFYLAKHNPIKLMKMKYRDNMGLNLDLKNPRNLDEKVNYMSFYSDTTMWSDLADKYKVREYLKKHGLGEILNELYGVYNTPEEIDISKLPDSFVLKTNHASATNMFVRDKNKLNIDETKKLFSKWLSMDYGIKTATPHYSRIKPCIIAEKYLIENGNPEKSLTDYKIYCFGGKPLYVFVFSDRLANSHEYTKMIYDLDWNPHPEFINKGLVISKVLTKPKSFDVMLKAASILSEPFPFVRVDFYEIDGNAIFSELTFTPGHNSAASREFLIKMGDLIDLSNIETNIK